MPARSASGFRRFSALIGTLSSALRISAAVCGRSAGRLARQRITSAASAGGTSARRRATGSGDSIAWAARSAAGGRPVNGGAPVSVSYARHPKA